MTKRHIKSLGIMGILSLILVIVVPVVREHNETCEALVRQEVEKTGGVGTIDPPFQVEEQECP